MRTKVMSINRSTSDRYPKQKVTQAYTLCTLFVRHEIRSTITLVIVKLFVEERVWGSSTTIHISAAKQHCYVTVRRHMKHFNFVSGIICKIYSITDVYMQR